MADKNFLRLDKVKQLGHYESAVLADAELLAGQFVTLGKVLKTAEGEEVEVKKATGIEDADALVAPVYVDRGFNGWNITTDSIPAGKPARAYVFEKGDMVSINEELASGLNVDDFVAPGAEGLGFAVAGSREEALGQVIDKNYLEGVGNLVVIRFL